MAVLPKYCYEAINRIAHIPKEQDFISKLEWKNTPLNYTDYLMIFDLLDKYNLVNAAVMTEIEIAFEQLKQLDIN